MRRRSFLAAVGASAAAGVVWPQLIRRAFADASFDMPGARKTAPGLPSANARAQNAARPLFVIVVPADDGKKYERGTLWGEYLNHGSARDLAPLAQVEVACATMKDVAALAPGIKGEPLAVVVAPDGQAQALDVHVPSYPTDFRYDGKIDEAVAARRIDAVACMIRGALPPVPPSAVRASADQVIRSLRTAPPSGSHWANASMCGPASVEGMKEDDGDVVVVYGCGMGHIPSKSSRFLYFFSKTPRQMDREYAAAEAKKAKK
jgi:hypothetical protein